jgi:hypothetical protein
MDNHDWIFEELSTLIQNPEAKAYIEVHRQKCYQEVKKYMLGKMVKASLKDDPPSLSSIFPKQSDEIVSQLDKSGE